MMQTWLGRRRRGDLMINTSCKALEAQWKAQEVKQSPSTKIGTKPDARSRRNELIEGSMAARCSRPGASSIYNPRPRIWCTSSTTTIYLLSNYDFSEGLVLSVVSVYVTMCISSSGWVFPLIWSFFEFLPAKDLADPCIFVLKDHI